MALALQPSSKTLSARPQAPDRPPQRANQPSRYLHLGGARDGRAFDGAEAPAAQTLTATVTRLRLCPAGRRAGLSRRAGRSHRVQRGPVFGALRVGERPADALDQLCGEVI